MWMQNFFKSLTSISARRRPTRRPVSRPCIEALEDRCLLSFSPAGDIDVGPYPYALALADLDGDGLLELGPLGSGHLTALGIGTYNSPIAADLNGDGIDDLVKITINLDLRVQLGNGDGTYQQTQVIVLPSQLPPGVGFYPVQNPKSMTPGDLNADGKLDLVATGFDEELLGDGTGRRDHYVNVLLGNGDGSFGPSSAYYVTSTFSNYGLADTIVLPVRDYDGDGQADILTTGDAVRLFAGNGDGTLQTPPSIFQGPWTMDANADGVPDRVDLVYTTHWSVDDPEYTTRHAYVRLGNGDGSFAPAMISDLGIADGQRNGFVHGLADFDGDGFPELVVSEYGDSAPYNVVSIAHNDGIWTPPPPPPPPSITMSDVTLSEGNTGTRAATFTVTLSSAASQPVTVTWATANGTATAGSDYHAASGTLTIPAGQTTGTITVLVYGDRLPEPNETFVVNLSSPTNATIADGQGVGTILDDEPRISISDVTKYEGKKGKTTLFVFTVTLSAAYDQPVTMSFQTVDGTAKTSDNDYVARTGTLTFSRGETTKTITISVNGDGKKEADETFYLDLFGNSGNSLFTKSRGIGTILNDD